MTTSVSAESGIRSALIIDQPRDCVVAAVSSECDTTVTDVTWCCDCAGDAITEFTIQDGDPDIDFDPVFRTASGTRYRGTLEDCPDCVVSTLEELGCPITSVTAEAGTLELVFYADGTEKLREIVTAVRETHDGVTLGRLSTGGDLDGQQPVVIDTQRLTDRQREVLETAHELGYFAHPKEANTGDLAAALDISSSTVAEHLALAQRKLMEAII